MFKLLKEIPQQVGKWAGQNPIRAFLSQFIGVPVLYVIVQLILTPKQLFVDPRSALWGLDKIVVFNTLVSVGLAIYIWQKNKQDGRNV